MTDKIRDKIRDKITVYTDGSCMPNPDEFKKL
jgi:hypothetical protein